jgi:quercetin dioxygenase-like cupin family protein
MTVVSGSSLTFSDLPGRRSADPLEGLDAESSMRIVEMTLDPDRRAHRHPESEEVVVVLEGAGEVWIEGERRPVGAGDVVHIGAGLLHATIPEGRMRLACFFPHPDLNNNIEESDRSVVLPPVVREEREQHG